jgi:DNA-binding NarL/FixJ family response regulator
VENNCGPILIVDDDPDFRELVSVLCSQAGFSWREAGTGADAVSQAVQERPGAVLLDVDLGDTSGYQACRELRERFGETLPIIFVSGTRIDSFDRIAGLLLGADDYVTKPFDPEELIARLRRAVARSAPSREDSAAVERSRLTPREQEVLILLADGLGTSAIAEQLHISPKTVNTHVQHVLVKFDVHNRAEAVAFAYRTGLMDADEARLLPFA